MQFEQKLQIQAQLESGIVECIQFFVLKRIALIEFLHVLPRDSKFCVSNGLQKQAGLMASTSGVKYCNASVIHALDQTSQDQRS